MGKNIMFIVAMVALVVPLAAFGLERPVKTNQALSPPVGKPVDLQTQTASDSKQWDSPLEPGEFRLKGSSTESRLMLEMMVAQQQEELGKIVAVKLYSLPSNTFIGALISPDVQPSALMFVWKAFERQLPKGTIVFPFNDSIVRLVVDAPPPQDHRVRIEYVTEKNQEYSTKEILTAGLVNFDAFQFSVTPNFDSRVGGNTVCGWCGDQFCGCKVCGVEYHLCCPQCTLYCQYVICMGP